MSRTSTPLGHRSTSRSCVPRRPIRSRSGEWPRQAANRAILDHGGTITHHHAVGTDHAAAYAEEVGPVGLAALRAVKRELDPAGILNPGVLLG